MPLAPFLQSIEELQEVSLDQLQWFVDNSYRQVVEEGDYLFRMGDAISGTHVVLSGKFRLFVPQASGTRWI